MALSPNYPPVYLGNLGYAYRLAGQFEEAIAAFKAYDARIPGFGFSYRSHHSLSGERPTGRSEANGRAFFGGPSGLHDRLMAENPVIRDTARLEADIAALRAAGLPMG